MFTTADLTPEAAREDTEKFLTAWDVAVRKFYSLLAFPFRPLTDRVFDALPPKEFLLRFLAAAGLASHPEVALPPLYPDRNEPRACFDLAALLPLAFTAVYAYAVGGEAPPERMREAVEVSLRSFSYLHNPAFAFRTAKEAGEGEVEQKLLSEKVSPRLAFAVRLYRARYDFETSLRFSLVLADPALATVSAPSLSLLSNLSYSYIIKLIKTKKLPARKQNGTWHIPVVDAAKMLLRRNDSPDWLRRAISEILFSVEPGFLAQMRR